MVLSGHNIFGERQGLSDGSGDGSERGGQPGSELVSVYNSSVEDETIYTVTTGKSLYIKTIIIREAEFGEINFFAEFRDGGSGGTTKIRVATPEDVDGGTTTLELNTPLEFGTDVYINSGSIGAVTIIGWEE